MLLSELFEQLTSGELSKLAIGGINTDGIHASNYPKIIPTINLGLTELYKRFPLKEDEVVIDLYDQLTHYVLDSKYAVTNTESSEPIKYIQDSEFKPFTDNIILIDNIYNELGEELFLNNTDQYYSIYTPSYNSIQVNYPEKENTLFITYKAKHDKIATNITNPETTEVNIPSSLLECLLFFIGSRLAIDEESNNYLIKFENSCKKVEELNLFKRENIDNIKLRNNGWV